jgi:hypothetical protein
MASGKAMKVKSRAEGGWERLLFTGPLNEDAKTVVMSLLDTAGPRCILDMGGVTFINSIGVRDWSYFLKQLKPNRELAYDNVPDDVVRSMNLMTNLQGNLPVRSVIRDYICPHCNHEQHERFEAGKDYTPGSVPTTAPRACAQCGNESEPCEPDHMFFQFLLGA